MHEPLQEPPYLQQWNSLEQMIFSITPSTNLFPEIPPELLSIIDSFCGSDLITLTLIVVIAGEFNPMSIYAYNKLLELIIKKYENSNKPCYFLYFVVK